jgi:competence protein ComEA
MTTPFLWHFINFRVASQFAQDKTDKLFCTNLNIGANRMNSISKLMIALVFCLISGFAVANPVNINTAGAAEISKSLNGIGMTKADAIIKDRETNGPFKSIDDLARVKGIGPATVSKNKELIIVK